MFRVRPRRAPQAASRRRARGRRTATRSGRNLVSSASCSSCTFARDAIGECGVAGRRRERYDRRPSSAVRADVALRRATGRQLRARDHRRQAVQHMLLGMAFCFRRKPSQEQSSVAASCAPLGQPCTGVAPRAITRGSRRISGWRRKTPVPAIWGDAGRPCGDSRSDVVEVATHCRQLGVVSVPRAPTATALARRGPLGISRMPQSALLGT
jgi:hypothetical protein